MKMSRLLKRLGIFILALALLAAVLPMQPTQAAMDPKTFYLSWPFTPPPQGNLNAFSPDGLTDNFPWTYLLTPTFGYYIWDTQTWGGWLAEKWGFTADGKAYQITLREGLTWSDGSPLTTKDVVSTFTIGKVTNMAAYSFGVSDVKAVDERTVNFELGGAPSLILERLIMKEVVMDYATYGALADKVAKLIEDGAKAGQDLAAVKATDAWKAVAQEITDYRPAKMNCSGPYCFDLADANNAQLIYKRAEKTYFGKMAKFEQVIIYNGDTEVTTPLYLKGELNYSTDFYPPATEKQLIEKGIKILRSPSRSGPALYINHEIYPLNRVEVRQAMAYAIDRQRVTTVAYDQIGKMPVNLSGISDALLPAWVDQATIDSLEKYEYNQAKATEILTGLGFKKDGDTWVDDKGAKMEFELSAPSDFTDWFPAAQDVADQLTEFGIKVTLRGIPNSQHVPEIREGKFQLALRLWGFPNPFPFYAYRNMYQFHAVGKAATDKGTSYPMKATIGGKEVDFAAMVAAMAAGTDLAPQKAAVTEAALAFNKDLPLIPLVERYYNCPLDTSNVDGFPPDGDPLYGNVNGSDNIIVVLLMEGRITPKS